MTSPMTPNRHKIDNYVIMASLKSEPMGKLINRIPGLRLLIPNIESEHDQEIPQLQTAHKPVVS